MKKILALVLVAVSVLGMCWGQEEPEFIGKLQQYVKREYKQEEGEPEWIYFSGRSMGKTSGKHGAIKFAENEARVKLIRHVFEEISGYERDESELEQMEGSLHDAEGNELDLDPGAMEKLQTYWEGCFSAKAFPAWEILEEPVWLEEQPNGKKYWQCAVLIRAPKSEVAAALMKVDTAKAMDMALDMLERKDKISVSNDARNRMEEFAEVAKKEIAKKVEKADAALEE